MAGGTEVTGLRETVRSLERFGVSVADLKSAFRRIGQLVATEAQSLVPVKSGRLSGTIRPSNTKNKSVVRAGGGRVVYASVQNYGGYHGIVGRHFMQDALANQQGPVLQALDDELSGLIRRNDLN